MENSPKNDFEVELSATLKVCQLSNQQPHNKDDLLANIKNKFVIGNPRAWWANLKSKPTVRQYEDDSGYLHINELAPRLVENVWFIVDENNEEKFLFEVPIIAVPNIIKECRFF
jgi:hypothetical protein